MRCCSIHKTGAIVDYPEKPAQGGILVNYSLPQAGSLLLYIANSTMKLPPPPASTLSTNKKEVTTSSLMINRIRPNVLTLAFCDLQVGDTLLQDQHIYNATDTLFKHFGFKDGDPWNTSVQYKNHTIRRDTFGANTGFTATYHFTVEQGTDISTLQAVVERTHLWKVSVNGKEVQPNKGQWWLDKDFSVFDIGKQVQTGENTITLQAPKMSVYAEIEPVYVLGNFNLVSDSKGWKIASLQPLQLGSWKEQGLPLYGHEVAYRKSFNVADISKPYEVELGDWKGTVALLKVNGQTATVAIGNTDQFDISPYLKKGKNVVEFVVVGSLKNTLGPHYNNPPKGLVSPWQWRNIKKQVPGNEYDLYDYGLIEDFKIYHY